MQLLKPPTNEKNSDLATPPQTGAAETLAPGATPNVGIKENPDIDAATNRAVAQHLSEQPAADRKKGKRLKTFPPASQAANGALAPVAETKAVQPPPVQIDEKAIEILVDGVLEMMNDMSEMLMRFVAKRYECSPTVTEEAVKTARMRDKTREMIKMGAMACAKKYAAQVQYAPETAAVGGIAFFGLSNYLGFRVLMKTNFTPTK
jgi:hypothetical protein